MNIKNTLITIFFIIYSILFCEWFVRTIDPQPLLPRYVTGTDAGIRGNIPNSKYIHTTADVQNIEMIINNAGMRSNIEFSYKKPTGICRIGIFGDSFFMGYESRYEDSFAVKLEEILKNRDENCEILNFSVSGFGTAESLIRLKTEGIKYDLDIAILEWHKSDPGENHRSQLYLFDGTSLVRDKMNYLPGISTRDSLMQYSTYRWLIQHSHLYSAARENIAITTKRLLSRYHNFIDNLLYYDPDYLEMDENSTDQPSDINTSADDALKTSLSSLLIDEFYHTASANNMDVLLLEVPNYYFFNQKLESALEFLYGTPQSEIIVLSPMEKFTKLNAENVQLYYPNGHYHLSPNGYQQLAEVAADGILKVLKNN